MEATKVISIVEQLDNSDGNGYWIKHNVSYFKPLYELDDEEYTNHRKKPKNPIIVLSKE